MIKNRYIVKFSSESGYITVHLTGEIDHHATVGLRHTIDREVQGKNPRGLVLDLSEVDFMDSAGLGLILGRYNLCAQLGISFAVTDPSPSARRIISAAGAERMIRILDSDTAK